MTSFTKNPHPQPKNFFSSAVVVGQNLGTNISYACSQSVKNIFCYFMLFTIWKTRRKVGFVYHSYLTFLNLGPSKQLTQFFEPPSYPSKDLATSSKRFCGLYSKLYINII